MRRLSILSADCIRCRKTGVPYADCCFCILTVEKTYGCELVCQAEQSVIVHWCLMLGRFLYTDGLPVERDYIRAAESSE